jgi:predicted polyphosphate/ATP-dependent NAD kinase
MTATPAANRRLGLLVNPIAGMGGRVALKGTDGAEALAQARARGAVPVAPERARRALAALARALAGAAPAAPAAAERGAAAPAAAERGADAPAAPERAGAAAPSTLPLEVVAGPGPLGAGLALAAGFATTATGDAPAAGADTTAADTRAAVAAMRERGVELLLFAGGDGTARDILDAGGAEIPLVGIPTGVKMHSGVFAATPDAAGAAAAAYLRAPDPAALRDAEIADVDEQALRAGRVSTRLYGSARVPRIPSLMLAAKAASASHGDGGLDALAHALADEIAAEGPGRLTLVGPGSSTSRVLAALGLEGTLLGVDAIQDGRLVGSDLDEAGLLRLLDAAERPRLLAGVVGGQGALFGRGNQQLSPRVLRRVGRDGIEVIAAADKLSGLCPPTLRVDTGDDELDAELSGYVRVRVAPRETIVMRVST